jgi:pre-rRNA-processing protein TSR3
MEITVKRQPFPPTVIIRHRLENLKKCSLTGLESRSDFIFITYPYSTLPPLENYLVLTLDAPPLKEEDGGYGLLVLDATWRYAAKMVNRLNNPAKHSHFLYRSLPAHYRTAYPRCQRFCSDPVRGLASIEAIYLSYCILGRETAGLLEKYYWKEEFLQINHL